MLGKLAELILFGIAPLALGGLLMPGAAFAEEVEIVGEVSYRERIALPANAVLSVQLADVSLADAPASVIAEQTIDPAGQVPIKFTLKFDSAVIQPKMNYAVQARITVDDKLWFINDERYSVDPTKAEPVQMWLRRVSEDTAPPAPALFDTTWLAEDIGGKGVIDDAQTTLSIAEDGSVTGRGGCNGYFSQATIDGEKISFGKAGSTMMACPEAMMDQERRFHEALEKTASFRFNEEGKLFLVDADGNDLVRFSNEG
ncbi:MAG: YbaY family lipoprotein [Mesorhizobium sp.]|nr:YbaY family lipoprotein [Mesorhizobium sp.]MBL8579383.1 YbaY family lipoprotein [Mesorhizobium sp.]